MLRLAVLVAALWSSAAAADPIESGLATGTKAAEAIILAGPVGALFILVVVGLVFALGAAGFVIRALWNTIKERDAASATMRERFDTAIAAVQEKRAAELVESTKQVASTAISGSAAITASNERLADTAGRVRSNGRHLRPARAHCPAPAAVGLACGCGGRRSRRNCTDVPHRLSDPPSAPPPRPESQSARVEDCLHHLARGQAGGGERGRVRAVRGRALRVSADLGEARRRVHGRRRCAAAEGRAVTLPRGRRPLVCYHEAGHAVARWWLGSHTDDAAVLTPEEVIAGETLSDGKGRPVRCEGLVNGHDIHLPMACGILAGSWDTDEQRYASAAQAGRRAVMAIIELYAGPHAEARFTERSVLDCFLTGGMRDEWSAREIAEAWFAAEEGRGARAQADNVAQALMRSPRAWAAVQAIASGLLNRGRVDGDEVDALCAKAYGAPFTYDRWATCWPPTDEQIRDGCLPPEWTSKSS